MRYRRSLEELGNVVDEAFPRVFGRSVLRRVHPDRVLWTSFDAKTANDAAQLVDDESGGEFFDHPRLGGRVARIVFSGFDVDALGGADCRAHVTGDTARLAVFARDQSMQSAIAGRIGDALLRVLHRGDQACSLA